MKKSYLAGLVLVFLGLMISCDEKTDDITENLIGSFSCTLNNTAWKASVMGGSVQNNNLIITSNKSKELITLSFGNMAVGKYPINISNIAIYTSNSDSVTQTTYTATTGEIEISSLDTENKRVSGSFHFEGYNTSMSKVTVTAGTFKNIIYQ